MQLRLSTPFEPYGRYLSAENIEVQLDENFVNSERYAELRKAFQNKAAELIRKFNELCKSYETSAQDHVSYEQTEPFLGAMPGVFNPVKGLEDLETASSSLFEESSMAHKWMNTIALLRKAANSDKLPPEKKGI